MPQSDDIDGTSPAQGGHFATTRWSVVLAAGHRSSPDSRRALETLCAAYWYPLYAYVRRRTADSHSARDLTQEFFATLLEKEYLRDADREKGRFRAFLLTAFKRFLVKQHEHAQAQKRGGGKMILSIDFEEGERRYQLEPSHDWTPEKIYERRWALTMLDQVLCRLQQEYRHRGKAELFDSLKIYLTGKPDAPVYEELGRELALSTGAVKVAVHRLRQRYRDLLKQEIAQTVAEPEEAEEERRYLLAVLGGEEH